MRFPSDAAADNPDEGHDGGPDEDNGPWAFGEFGREHAKAPLFHHHQNRGGEQAGNCGGCADDGGVDKGMNEEKQRCARDAANEKEFHGCACGKHFLNEGAERQPHHGVENDMCPALMQKKIRYGREYIDPCRIFGFEITGDKGEC